MSEAADDAFRILVVDDEPVIREFLSIAFGEEGYAVETAGSGDEALKILAARPVDTVFTDIRMPGMDGIELLQRVRASWPETEVVIMTSHASVETAVNALRQGAYDYLLKPVEDVEVLLALAKRVKEKRDLVGELRTRNATLVRLAAEITALQDWSRRLALSLDAAILHKTAVEGLSALSGRGATALYALPNPRGRFVLSATSTASEASASAELPFGASDAPGGRAGFSTLGGWDALRRELEMRQGSAPENIHPLIVGGEPYGFLVEFEPLPDDEPRNSVAPGTITQFVAAIATALGNALLYRSVSEATLKDGLTGLFNHRYFQERLRAEIARAERSTKPISLLFFDIDHFKHLNDSQGHPIGDRVLLGVADILRNSSRVSDVPVKLSQTDIVARYGGEEFVLILPETSCEDAKGKAERLRLAVESYPFPGREMQPGGKVTISCGMSEFPRDAQSAKGLIAAADAALYEAKRSGRNRVVTSGNVAP